MSTPACTVSSIDHIVLTCRSIPDTVAFYERLGMKHQAFTSPKDPSVTRHALTFGGQKINLHQSGKEFEPKAQNVMPGSADVCFLTEDSVDEVLKSLRGESIEVLEGGGVVERTGARSQLRSLYVRDPDLNLVE